MDNVLIDERRIKVDFSQSVAKMNKYSLPKGWNVGEGKRGGKVSSERDVGASKTLREYHALTL